LNNDLEESGKIHLTGAVTSGSTHLSLVKRSLNKKTSFPVRSLHSKMQSHFISFLLMGNNITIEKIIKEHCQPQSPPENIQWYLNWLTSIQLVLLQENKLSKTEGGVRTLDAFKKLIEKITVELKEASPEFDILDECSTLMNQTISNLTQETMISFKAGDPQGLSEIKTWHELISSKFMEAALNVVPRRINATLLLGRSGSGKSTLINAILGKQVAATGYCSTTKDYNCYSENQTVLIDSPGISDETDFLNLKNISFIKGLSQRLIVVNHSPFREMSSVIRILDHISLSYTIVVNKCDECPIEELELFYTAVLEEHKENCAEDSPIFFVSAANTDFHKDWIPFTSSLTVNSPRQPDTIVNNNVNMVDNNNCHNN